MQDGAHYMIYTPSDPLLFVAVKVTLCILEIITFSDLSAVGVPKFIELYPRV